MQFVNYMKSANWTQIFWVALGAYALGCLTSGYYLFRSRTGRDLRELGSGSLGARNVGRFLGAPGFFFTLLCDITKGALAVWLAQCFTGDKEIASVALLAVTAGHIWPVQLGFRGGKGVATALGGLGIFSFGLLFGFGCIFLLGLIFFRRSVVAGLLAFLGLPVLVFSLQFRTVNPADRADTVTVLLLAVLVIVAHRRNLLQHSSRFFHDDSVESPAKPKL
jgi:glycerol-3-phosphate acyltransferase PlsY